MSEERQGRDSERPPFTQHAGLALKVAREESFSRGHNYIGQEHLLLAFQRDPECTAARVFSSIGFDARAPVEFLIGDGAGFPTAEPGLTPRAARALGLAYAEARRLQDVKLDTAHILLGMLKEGEGIGSGVLREGGIGVDEIETALATVEREL
ncbi:MAG TPA: Clp protease N-terminal domain-containing protein [Dehalococcoidia bacterium]|nr:Clp protease N-terminal domain-containing protein [Dehalococcoidia bacterium]